VGTSWKPDNKRNDDGKTRPTILHGCFKSQAVSQKQENAASDVSIPPQTTEFNHPTHRIAAKRESPALSEQK
jgi:hypothetical protein